MGISFPTFTGVTFPGGIAFPSGTNFNGWSSPYPTLSHDFELSSIQSLTRTDLAGYDTSKIAFSCWYKRESVGSACALMHHLNDVRVRFNLTDNIEIRLDATNVLVTTAAFNDTAAFHHLYFIFDISLTSGNMNQLWIDGVRITDFSAVSEKSTPISNSGGIAWAGEAFDGLIYQWALFSGGYPTAAQLYNGGKPVNIRSFSNLYSALDPNISVTKDFVLVTDWTNNNAVVTSTTIPG